MKKEQKTIIKHSFWMLFICVIGVTLVFIGSSYALISSPVTLDASIVNIGSLQISYDSYYNRKGDVINLNSSYPCSDETGLVGKSYQFTLTNTSDKDTYYQVQILNDDAMAKVEGCSDRLVSLDLLRYNINNGVPVTLGSLEESNYVVSEGVLKAGESHSYSIRIWVSEDADEEIVLNQHYHGRLVVRETEEKQ